MSLIVLLTLSAITLPSVAPLIRGSYVQRTRDILSATSHANSDKLQPVAGPVPIVLNEDDLDEKFVKGQGNGGQKINKTSNRVVLVHKPTNIKVQCQDARDLSTNRKWARDMLRAKLDEHINGVYSKAYQEQMKEKKRKKNAERKSKRKYSDKVDEDSTKDQGKCSPTEKENGDEENIESLLRTVRERNL